jgi:uncharacterized protein YkwD
MVSRTGAAAAYIVLIGAATVAGSVAIADTSGEGYDRADRINETAVEQAMHSELNDLRAAHDVAPATYNARVGAQATAWSNRMVNGSYEHSPRGYYACGRGMAENIATLPAYGAVELDTGEIVRYDGNETRLGHALVGVWNRSPPHRENMLDPTHTAHAPGIAVGERNGSVTVFATSAFCAE